MFDKIIQISLQNKLLIGLGVIILIVTGIYSAFRIPIDAVPDITNNQVQIVTVSPTLAPQEVEQLVTFPVETAMTNIPDVTEVRSISRYGLSVVTIVFEDHVPMMLARQFVQEQINLAKSDIPSELGEPEMMPITTGLGEIYQYVLTVDPGIAHKFDAVELRTIQDWIVKRQLNGTPGIIEVSSFGGYLKRYEVAVNPELLKAFNLTMQDVLSSLEKNNQNSGGSYIEKGPYSYYIRTEGRSKSISDLESIVIKVLGSRPILVKDIANVTIGSPKRYGAMTMDGKGEVVGGITLMLKGANSYEAIKNVKERIEIIKSTLPEGIDIYPYLDRSKLIEKTISTASTNLLEGGLIVIFILLILLGNFRAGLIVASVIPLSMLFALNMMNLFGVSANLMSLGAIDFGIVVDGAVIIVESLLHTIAIGYMGKKLTQAEMDQVVITSTSKIYRSAAFGVLIILIVFIPILSLQGIEGKTFRPMAQTVAFAIFGSLILSITYVPVMVSIFIKKTISSKRSLADRLNSFFQTIYRPILNLALKFPYFTIGSTVMVFLISISIFLRLGSEFIPTLEEGDLAMQQTIKPGSSLQESIRSSSKAEKILLSQFPEVLHVVSKIGTAEVPTDPMAIEDADIMIILKDKEDWTSATTREELVEKMKLSLAPITWAAYEFTQPIQLRFNELMTGSKSDIAIKVFGEDRALLKSLGDEAGELIKDIEGVGDVRVDQTEGLQQLSVQYNRQRIARYGLNIDDLNQVIRAAFAGEQVGHIFEQERKFDLVLRVDEKFRQELDLTELSITTNEGFLLPLSEVATVVETEGPMLISREQAKRYINIGVNVRNRDVASLVQSIKNRLQLDLEMPPGYHIEYGGQFENLQNARARLSIALPIALLLIFLLLHMAFGSVIDSLIILIAVPFSAVGGILGLLIRDMPFSISSGVGFIALFGVSVLNGIVLLSYIKQLDLKDFQTFKELIQKACLTRLRPVLMTALVAALGFIPMALSTGSGAEVQRPLATVVIAGLITSTLLTLVALPAVYYLIYKRKWKRLKSIVPILILVGFISYEGQTQDSLDINQIVEYAETSHPEMLNSSLHIDQERLAYNGIGQVNPLSLKYQFGQINFSGIDHQFNVSQDMSFLFGKSVKRNAVAAKIKAANNQFLLNKQSLSLHLRTIYNELLFQHGRVNTYEKLWVVYDKVTANINARYTEGEIDFTEKQLLYNDLLILEKEITTSKNEYEDIKAYLRELAFLPDSIAIRIHPLNEIQEPERKSVNDTHPVLMQYEVDREVLESEIILEKQQSNQPNFSIEYFLQSLEKDVVFQGAGISAKIPVDKRVSRTKMDQLKLGQLILENQKTMTLSNFQRTLALMYQKSASLKNTIQRYKGQSVTEDDLHLSLLEQQLSIGEINFFEFSQMIRRITESQITYNQLIRDYNEIIIQIQFITNEI